MLDCCLDIFVSQQSDALMFSLSKHYFFSIDVRKNFIDFLCGIWTTSKCSKYSVKPLPHQKLKCAHALYGFRRSRVVGYQNKAQNNRNSGGTIWRWKVLFPLSDKVSNAPSITGKLCMKTLWFYVSRSSSFRTVGHFDYQLPSQALFPK